MQNQRSKEHLSEVICFLSDEVIYLHLAMLSIDPSFSSREKGEAIIPSQRGKRSQVHNRSYCGGRCAGQHVSPVVLKGELLAKVGTPLYFYANFKSCSLLLPGQRKTKIPHSSRSSQHTRPS